MASSPLDVIKSYLISLGFEVDKSSYDSATKAIDSAGESLAKLAGTTVKQFGLATVAVTSFVTTAVVGMAKFLNDLGNAQIRYEMLARQMWTTQQNAEALDTTLKAMGTTLQDLYLSPTLMQQFMELHQQSFQMMPPAEYQQQMAFIQSISFEFKRMKLEGTYALQWIGYYFIKYMSGPIVTIKNTLSQVNDIIIKTMPYWTKVVAQVMSWFAQFGLTTVEALKDIGKAFFDIGNSIPNNIKLVGLAIAALFLILNQGPIGWFIDAFVLLGLALNDFFTYIHGGKAEFGWFWQKLIDLYDRLKSTGEIDKFKRAFQSAMQTISHWIDVGYKGIKDFLSNTDNLKAMGTVIAGIAAGFLTFKTIEGILKAVAAAQWLLNAAMDANPIGLIATLVGLLIADLIHLGKLDALTNIIGDFGKLLLAIVNVVGAVGDYINLLLKLAGLNGDVGQGFKQIGDWINQFIVTSLETVDTLLKQITSALNAVGDVFHLNWGKAWKDFSDIFTKDTSPMRNQSYMYPNSNHQTNNSNQTSMTVTQNIYGTSDPNATANAASSNITTILRNQKGMIV